MTRLRVARVSERDSLEALQRRASLANPGDKAAIEAHSDAVELPATQIAEGHVFVAEDAEGVVAGFAVVLPRAGGDAELDGLFVDPGMQRRGVGRDLVSRAAEVARARGAAWLWVVGNPHAEAFYRDCGFVKVGTTETRFGPAATLRLSLPRTVEAWLRDAARAIVASQSPRLDARLIARHVLGLDEAALIAEGARPLSADEEARLAAALARRVAGEPIAYITGIKEFWGLPIRCRAPILLPRPDSETAIAAAIARRPESAALSILDLGVGTGCLLAALLTAFPKAHGTGVDAHPAAVALARENLAALGLDGRGTIREGSWADGLSGPFDLIVANPPYIPETERDLLSFDILGYEDPAALFGGADGLSAYRAILDASPAILAPDGLLIFEIGAGQQAAVSALAAAAFPGAAISADADLGGRPRALVVDCMEKTG